jgi:hypothetical protein
MSILLSSSFFRNLNVALICAVLVSSRLPAPALVAVSILLQIGLLTVLEIRRISRYPYLDFGGVLVST